MYIILRRQYLDRIQTQPPPHRPADYFIIVIYTLTDTNMSLVIQSAPPAQDFNADSIQVSAKTATPQASMANIKAQADGLNAVNSLSGGGRSRRGRGPPRRTQRRQQTGGSSQSGGQITIPQVGPICNSGPQCSAVQNANLTAVSNQAKSSSANDAYATKTGGRKKVRFSRTHRTRSRSHRRKSRHDQSITSMVAYNIKKVMRKVFA
jgi:hypothetical protein